jgi:hypothetical protein
LIQLKTRASGICHRDRCLEEMAVTPTTMIFLASMVSLFAAFAAGLAWAQQHARQLSAASVEVPRSNRRPF